MTRFYISIRDFDKWMYQNKGEYLGNYEEGVLCDSFTVATKRGTAFVYEHVRTEWTSDYYVEFVPDKNEDELKKAWAKWCEFETACAAEENAVAESAAEESATAQQKGGTQHGYQSH